jgi:hypothetical protein
MATPSSPPSNSPASELLQRTHTDADQGDSEAQFLLGVHYGAIDELTQSETWYRKAAAQEHVLAQFNLGIIYARGQGVNSDTAASVQWMQKAANGGDAGAQFFLGVHFHRASLSRTAPDVGDHRIESFKWFQLASQQDYPESVEFRNRVTQSMSWEEVAEANRRADRFAEAPTPAVETVPAA